MDKWKPSSVKGKVSDIENQENDFLERIHGILSDNHYGFLTDIKDLQYDNKFCWTFSGIIGALTNKERESLGRLDIDKFIELLKKKNIKRVAEIGPGEDSMLFPMTDTLQEAGCEVVMISDSILHNVKDRFKDAQIKIVDKKAGELKGEKLNLDLIVAHNVFSIGGHNDSLSMIDKDLVNDLNKNAIDLIHQLSDNPNASIVFVEQYDCMPIDKSVIAKEANVLVWYRWPGPGSSARLYEGLNEHDPSVEKTFKEAPNFIVLQKKAH